MSRSGDAMPRLRAASGTPHQSIKHCKAEELEKIEDPICKKVVHCFKESRSSTNSEVITRVKWSKEEDEILTQMVNKHGHKNWQSVGRAIPGRSAQQCRARWRYKLDSANKEAWSQDEELRLIRAHQIYGNKWREMVKHFPGRTNGAIKDYWRGPMKRKVDSYISSGLLEQFPDILENISDPQNSDSDIVKNAEDSDILRDTDLSDFRKDTEGSSDRDLLSSDLPTNSKPEVSHTEVGENAETLEGNRSDFMYVGGLDADSAEVPQKIMARSEQHARTRKRLDFLSNPVELKLSTAEVNTQRPLQKRKQMSPDILNISPSNICEDIPSEVPSECANRALSPALNYQPNDHSEITFDPWSPELNISDIMDMSFFDNLLIFPPDSPNDGNSI